MIDAIIIGAGAAGLMTAICAAKRGKKVLLLEHNKAVGQKILISGGGRCNFINQNPKSENYISENPHFTKSIFSRYSVWDFIGLVAEYEIEYYEKKLGQLFCKGSSQQIINMLLSECEKYKVSIALNCDVRFVEKKDNLFTVLTNQGNFTAEKVVVSSGGLSFPNKGASGIGYEIAEHFSHRIVKTRPALVPFTLVKSENPIQEMAGISFDSIAEVQKPNFRENVLITHKGLSGTAILQISSYWKSGESISINIEPDVDFEELFEKHLNSKVEAKTILSEKLASKLAEYLLNEAGLNKPINQLSPKKLKQFLQDLKKYKFYPSGTEGYIKAEVTAGGVDTNELDQKTMESKLVSGLYFVGEVVDVTGWLGGYNFYWAWASGFVAGEAI